MAESSSSPAASSSSSAPGGARTTGRELFEAGIAKDPHIIGVKVGDKTYDLQTPFVVPEGVKPTPVRASDPAGLAIVRHSTAHVMADAVQRLFPGTKVTFGPATAHGFYYDFDKKGGTFTDEDLAHIEEKMREIIAAGAPFRRVGISRDEARALFEKMGETYKREHIENIPEGEEISLYFHGDGKSEWVDLCEGPHVPSTKFLQAVKLTSVAGAYWRGDERNPMLQRIYGTAFPSQKEMDAHLKLLAEAKERDHRKLGKELELFMMHEYAPAMPFFLPRGAVVYNGLIQLMRQAYVRHGYEEVITPQIFDKKLFLTSGHLPNYRENMYLPVTADDIDKAKLALRVDVPQVKEAESDPKSYRDADRARDRAVIDQLEELESLGAKPMNCPSHCLIFASRRRSYRDLPWRMADFGRLHRYERGGVVHGLSRVRSFCQDDAHIFCAEEQIQSEVQAFIKLLYEVYAAIKFERVDIKLATRPEKRIGTDEQWDRAEGALAQALNDANLPFEWLPGEGAFYGDRKSTRLNSSHRL